MQADLLNAYRWSRQQSHGSFYEALRSPASATDALAMARADVANGTKRYPLPTAGRGMTQGWNPRGDDGARWVESLSAAGLRFVGYADEIASLRHNGYYTEDDGVNGEVMRGVVLQLPGHGRRARYLAAYEDPCNPETYRVDVSSFAIHLGDVGAEGYRDDSGARDAALAADGFAERTAESEREYNAAWQAGSQWAGLGEEISTERRAALALLTERRTVKGVEAPTICAALTGLIKSKVAEISTMRRKRDELAESIWRQHYSAFNEGAGSPVLS